VEPLPSDVRNRDPQEAGPADAAFTHGRWHVNEVYVNIYGKMHYLWPAVDHEAEVLESFASKTRDNRRLSVPRPARAQWRKVGVELTSPVVVG